MQDFKTLMQSFIDKLFFTVQGSIHAYLSVTESLPEEQREDAWKTFNQAFEEHVVARLLEVMEQNNCGVAELCHATLKLMDIAAISVQKLETDEATEKEDNEAIKAWFMPTTH
ncbi:MAG: hypothetical protein AB1500_10195 [Bacillota bacterium]